MKAFRFRLEQALRWRETQRAAQQTRVAAAAARKADIARALDAARHAMDREAAEVRAGPTGDTLASYGVQRVRSQRRCESLGIKLTEATRILDGEIVLWLEMNRKVRLLERLRESGQAAWKAEFERELEAFAAESFLGRQSRA